MRKVFILLISFGFFIHYTAAQTPFVTCIINFEDNPCWEASYHSISIPATHSIWQIGVPQKQLFDSAFSHPNAILTDSIGNYPRNDTSAFIVKVARNPFCECAPSLGGFYKFDSDTLKDFGRIEISFNHGANWLNALSDTVIPDMFWMTPKPVLTGRIHHWTHFFTHLPFGFPNDTIYYRFTFISDNIETNQEGWMLDDLEIIEHTEGIADTGPGNEIQIYPNPAKEKITISGDNGSGACEVALYNSQGQACIRQTMQNPTKIIDISGIPGGLYMVRILGKNKVYLKKLIKE